MPRSLLRGRFTLSRYAHLETAITRPLELFCRIEGNNGTKKYVFKGISRKSLDNVLKYLKSMHNRIKISMEDGEIHRNYQQVMDSIQAFRYLDDDVFQRVQRLGQEIMDTYLRWLPGTVLFHSRNGTFDVILEDIRKDGASYSTFFVLTDVISKMLEEELARFDFSFSALYSGHSSNAKEKMQEDEIIGNVMALKVLWGLFYVESDWQYSFVQSRKRTGLAGDLGRIRFSPGETNAWRYVRNNFGDLNEQIILKATRYAQYRKRYHTWEDGDTIRECLELHCKYAMRQSFELNGFRLRLEASPFAEKPIGKPIGNFVIAVYPEDPQYIRPLKRISDPTFEHSDGAIAAARLTIRNGKLILEEIQSDVEAMLKLQQDEYGERLKPLVVEWKNAAMEALRIFAMAHGFKEFYAATPYRVLSRYWGEMHPDKVRLYFDGWEKMGGKFVYDSKYELDKVPQYYYVFNV